LKKRAELRYPYSVVLKALVEKLFERFRDDLISVVVFGSVARGEARKESDLDLLLVIRNLPRSRFRRQDLFMEVEEELEELLRRLEEEGYMVDFSPILKTPEEAMRISPLYLDMVYDAIILFDRDEFFKKVLDRLRKRLEELGARRIRLGKLWYWVLKEKYRFGEVIDIG